MMTSWRAQPALSSAVHCGKAGSTNSKLNFILLMRLMIDKVRELGEYDMVKISDL